MIAPKSEDILSALEHLDSLTISTYVDYDIANRRLSEFECFKVEVSEELKNSFLANIISRMYNNFGTVRDEYGVALCSLTMSVDMTERGYILYFKLNPYTKTVDVLSVNEDFLNFLYKQHTYVVKKPAALNKDYLNCLEASDHISKLDVTHRINPPKCKTFNLPLEERLSSFNTTIGISKVNVSNGLLVGVNKTFISLTEVDSFHSFSSEFLNKLKDGKRDGWNATMVSGHGGLAIVYRHDNDKLYTVNKLVERNELTACLNPIK